MAYPVERIIPVNINLQAPGLQYANFVSVRAFGVPGDLVAGATFDVNTYRTYDGTPDVALDFSISSPVYYAAQNWFNQTPKPSAESFTVWMRDEENDTSWIDTLNLAEDSAGWAYNVVLPVSAYQENQSLAQDLASWADENEHMVVMSFSDPASLDQNIDTDIPSALLDLGSRRVTQKFRSAAVVAQDPKQAYAGVAEMAYFQRFNPTGRRTSVDPEFGVLTNVLSDDLRTSQYSALEDRKLGFYTDIELKGEVVRSRVKNSWTTSAYNETVDDVFTLDVFKNYLQVNEFNYISQRKRGLRSPRDYAGALAVVDATCRTFNENGSFASEVDIEHPVTGETVRLKNGYLILSQPEDVNSLTAAQISAREYPVIQVIVVLARSARVIQLNVNVE